VVDRYLAKEILRLVIDHGRGINEGLLLFRSYAVIDRTSLNIMTVFQDFSFIPNESSPHTVTALHNVYCSREVGMIRTLT